MELTIPHAPTDKELGELANEFLSGEYFNGTTLELYIRDSGAPDVLFIMDLHSTILLNKVHMERVAYEKGWRGKHLRTITDHIYTATKIEAQNTIKKLYDKQRL